MSLAKKGQKWLKNNYEMVILLVAIASLLGSAVFLFIRAEAENRKLDHIRSIMDAEGSVAEPVDVASLGDIFAEVRQPVTLREMERRMFVSEQRVACVSCSKPISYHAEECPFCGAQQPPVDEQVDLSLDSSGDGIPDWWKEKHGFDVHDPRDAHEDADGDGFTNLEEYLAGTNPHDPDCHPPYIEKLRLIRVDRGEFRLRFNSVQEMPGGVKRFQLNLRTLERTYFPHLGDVINDEDNNIVDVKIVEFIPDADAGPTLIVEREGDRISLVRDELETRYDLTAVMVFLVDRKPVRAEQGDSITLRGEEYIVVELRRNSVTLECQSTGERTQVQRLTEEERRRLRGEPEREAPDSPEVIFERFGDDRFNEDAIGEDQMIDRSRTGGGIRRPAR